MNAIISALPVTNNHENNIQQSSISSGTRQNQNRIGGVIAVKNSPEAIFHRIPAITEAIASYLKEPDYSNFVAAVKGTSLRPLKEIYRVHQQKNLPLDALRPHERQLRIALQLQQKELSDSLKKTVIVELTQSEQKPYVPFPLGTIALGCLIPRQNSHAGIVHYVDYYDGTPLPLNLVGNDPIATALLKWKKEVMAKNDALKRLFAGGSSVMLTPFQEDASLLSIPIYKTELNHENFAILLKVADEQAANAPLLEKYGLIFLMMRFAVCLKKNNLRGLSGFEINEALFRYSRLLETGRDILGVLPGKILYQRP
ncbi:hypothetical protein [Sodalis ligni]|uniref:Uncharacterized protein n=1 Tax=Sodalis ligni TaxID=2697027 RepID=A0A4R1NDL8_9GAMM|nr:hypothetical protein [Sodalis ligni]TCL02696.1 hypothetical protein EZJ58_0726 [Sodalis ligni]